MLSSAVVNDAARTLRGVEMASAESETHPERSEMGETRNQTRKHRKSKGKTRRRGGTRAAAVRGREELSCNPRSAAETSGIVPAPLRVRAVALFQQPEGDQDTTKSLHLSHHAPSPAGSLLRVRLKSMSLISQDALTF